MTEELGKIEKPPLDQFKGKRKLYVIPLIYAGTDAPPDYTVIYERYWQQVMEQINVQESRVGSVQRIYHETIAQKGTEGLNLLEKLNALSFRIVRVKIENGATLEAMEDMDLLEECMDWERCLMMGFLSSTVAGKITEAYRDANNRRFQHISQLIDETLQENEVGILFIRQGHQIKFPPDTDIFMMAPPALDEINRWLRSRQEQADKTPEKQPEMPENQDSME